MDINAQKQLEELRGTANGEALKIWITENIEKMSDIKKLTPENVQSRKVACEILENLFNFLDVKTAQNSKPKYN